MYTEILALIHHRHFDQLAKACALYIRKYFGLSEIPDVLDIGCGGGALLKELSPSTTRITGIDISPHMLGHCKRLVTESKLIQGDVLEVSLPQTNCIAMVGEILSYAMADVGSQDLESALERFSLRYSTHSNEMVYLSLTR